MPFFQPPSRVLPPPSRPPFNVLVLCTGNSARSILGEGLFNHLGKGRLKAYSAGSRPAGYVNPVALETLEKHGIHLPDPYSKSWEEFTRPGAPRMDLIITLCDNAAREACPAWPGRPVVTHWGISDPAHLEPLASRRAGFQIAYQQLERRIKVFLALPLESMGPNEIKAAARRIHEVAGQPVRKPDPSESTGEWLN